MKPALLAQYVQETGLVEGVTPRTRRLDELAGKFLDDLAYQQTLQNGNPIIYSVSIVEPADGDGQLHYGIGKLMPGKIGSEYYFTLGHVHAYRAAAEVYIGLSGEGLMLLQHEETGETQVQPLKSSTIVYVPGYTAHRTINTGAKPLIYLGVYPAQAGHDYGIVAQKNFNDVVLDIDGEPVVIGRQEALGIISKRVEKNQA
ncbi:MAG: glucose-6-phosphate isomerase family protein [Anaerolineales bacterium]